MTNLMKKNWLRNQHGGITIIAAFAIPVVLIATGLAVDLNRFMSVSGYIQSSVDQAALAATSTDGDRDSVARKFYEASLSSDVRQYVTPGAVDVDVSPATNDSSLAVQVTAAATVETVFGAFVGVDTFELIKTAKAERFNQNVEAVIAMATGGSMCTTKERVPGDLHVLPGEINIAFRPDTTCGTLTSMRDAVKSFIANLGANDTVRNLKIGLVPYNFKVKMPDLNKIPPSLLANERKQFFSDVSDAESLDPVQPLTSDLLELTEIIDEMDNNVNTTAWSRSDLASHVGALMLDPSKQEFFPGGETPTTFDDDDVNKVMIIMSDGINTGCCYTNWPRGNFSNQYLVLNRDYNRDQLEICKALKDAEVEIFTVLFDVKETDSGGPEIHNVFARCATEANIEAGATEAAGDDLIHCRDRQNCFNVSSRDELGFAFKQISQRFYRPVLTK